jgi:hypothetical protein
VGQYVFHSGVPHPSLTEGVYSEVGSDSTAVVDVGGAGAGVGVGSRFLSRFGGLLGRFSAGVVPIRGDGT